MTTGSSNHLAPIEHVIWGVTSFWTETGMEGGRWTLQDIRGVDLSADRATGRWSYPGIVVLESGDHLTIYDPASTAVLAADPDSPILSWEPNRVLWQGIVDLDEFPPFTEDAEGLWIHNAPRGVSRTEWAERFFEPHPACLVTRRRPWVVGTVQLREGSVDGRFNPTPSQLLLASDGSVRWQMPDWNGDTTAAPYELRLLMHRLRE